MPLREVIETLRAMSYEGYISFEWEKYWHPEIEEPEVALPDFMTAMLLILGAEAYGRSGNSAPAKGKNEAAR